MSIKNYSSYPIRKISIVTFLFMLFAFNLTVFAASTDNKITANGIIENESGKSWSINPYLTQSVHLKWIEEGGIIDFQGLLIPELGAIIEGNPEYNVYLFFDFSVATAIFDIYNIQFSPVDLNINKASLTYKTDYYSKYLPENLKLELYPGSDPYNLDMYNFGLETKWSSKNDLEIFAELLLYNLFDETGYNFSKNNYGLIIGAQWFDIFNMGVDKSTDFKIEYEGLKNNINLHINQQINDSLSLEVDYNQNCHISANVNYNISKNWQYEITGLLFNDHHNHYNETGQSFREFSITTSLSYRF